MHTKGNPHSKREDITVRVRIPEVVEEDLIKYVVIVAMHDNKLVFCQHRSRDTWELPAGHREPHENALEAADRELREETGASEYSLTQLWPYSVLGKTSVNESGVETFGMLFSATIQRFGELRYEIGRIAFFEEIPDRLTYPEIQPLLIKCARDKTQAL